MTKTRSFLSWIILITGTISLSWTVLLHGQLYGFDALPRAGSTVALLLATLFLMLTALITSRGPAEKKALSNWWVTFLNRNADAILAVLLPTFLFALLFLFSPSSLNPFWDFIRTISLPLLLYFLLLMLILILIEGQQILSIRRKKPGPQDQILEIGRNQLHRRMWVLFIFLAVSNFLASFVISISKTGSFAGLVSSIFEVEREASIYTYASALFLLLISVGFGMLANFSSNSSIRITWVFLSSLFLAFSIDEVISIHEGVIASLRQAGAELTTSVFAYLLPVGILILVILYLVIRSIINHKIAGWGLFLAGFAMLMGGAVFVESITESLEMLFGEGLMPLVLVKSLLFLEEGLELSGTYLIFFFVMDQFFNKREKLQIRLGPAADM